MYVSIAYFEDPYITDTLKIVKKISDGKLEVYHMYSAFEKKAFALKMFPNDALGTRQYKKELLISRLSHPNIIKYIPATVISEDDSHFHCIITEFAKYGNLLDMVVDGVFTSEILIRTYFLQLIAGVEYMHSQGVAHLDLKLENLMIGSRLLLKIIDFDQAQFTKDKKVTSGGTDGYRAPEIIDGSCKNFQAADVYSLGIVLYGMKAQSAPFAEVTIQDGDNKQRTSLTHYCTFIKNNAAFWKGKTKPMNDPGFFSEDFKELINGMLQFDVSKRFTLNDVKNSKWFKGPTLSREKLRAEMGTRLQLL